MKLATTAEAAAWLGVPAKTIQSWKNRRRIMPVKIVPGRGRGGSVDIYDIEDLRPLADAYHQRKHGLAERS